MRTEANTLRSARVQFPITTSCLYFDLANTNSPTVCVTNALARYFCGHAGAGR